MALGLCHWSWLAGSSSGSVLHSFVSGAVAVSERGQAERADAELSVALPLWLSESRLLGWLAGGRALIGPLAVRACETAPLLL